MSEKRHFTVVEGKKEHGLFVGRSPSSVAKKVVSKLSKGGKKVIFELREITQGSKKKTYGPYEGIKKKLSDPVKIGDRVYKYESKVHRVKRKGGETQEYYNKKAIEESKPNKIEGEKFIAKYTSNPNFNIEQIEISIPGKKFVIVMDAIERDPFIRFPKTNRPTLTLFSPIGKNLLNSIIKEELIDFIKDDLQDIRYYSKFEKLVKKILDALEPTQ